LFKEKTMPRFALLICVAMLAGCAGLEAQQEAASWTYFDQRIQECMRWASVSYCRDEIYGHNG
jgi:hypothetical protein